MSFWDSHTAPVLVSIGMEMTPPILDNLPPEVQAYVAAQEAELSGLKQEFLGVSLDHAAAQKRLKGEKASAEAALAAERTAHARAIQNRDTIIADLHLQLNGHKKHRFGSKSENSAQLALGVCQTSCPPISCGVSDFRCAGIFFWVQPDGPCGLPVSGFS